MSLLKLRMWAILAAALALLGLLEEARAAPESLPYVLGRIARDKARAALRGRRRDEVHAHARPEPRDAAEGAPGAPVRLQGAGSVLPCEGKSA